MKFDLRSKVRFIACNSITTNELAYQCIEKMYWHAYGSKMGRPLYADGLTPNEERLTVALRERFSEPAGCLHKINPEPLSVDCGEHTYVFASIIPYEGPWIDFVDRVGCNRN
jgi:hypothetical protein